MKCQSSYISFQQFSSATFKTMQTIQIDEPAGRRVF